MRTDLLALSDDDLVALTNRGTVKRARAEVEAGAPSVELAESGELARLVADAQKA